MTQEKLTTIKAFNHQASEAYSDLSLAVAPTSEALDQLDPFTVFALILYTDTMDKWVEICKDQNPDPSELKTYAFRVKDYTIFAREALDSLNQEL